MQWRTFFQTSILMGIAISLGCDPRVPTGPDSNEAPTYYLSVSTNRSAVYADYGKTLAQITATLKNEDQEPMGGRTIYFSTTSGVIGSPLVTTSSGQARTYFDDDGILPSDPVRIIARYTDENNATVRDTVLVTVLPLESLVNHLQVEALPSQVIVHVIDSSYAVTIRARLLDSMGVAVENVPVYYQSLIPSGYLSSAVDTTDNNGRAEIIYTNDEGLLGDFPITAQVREADVQAAMQNSPVPLHLPTSGSVRKDEREGEVVSIQHPAKKAGPAESHKKGPDATGYPILSKGLGTAGAILFQDTVVVQFLSPDPYILSVVTSEDTIFADNGVTVSEIRAILKDSNNRPISGQSIQFSATKGVIESPIVTNNTGVAMAIFQDVGPSQLGQSKILVKYFHPFFGLLQDSLTVHIIKESNPSGERWPYTLEAVTSQDTVFIGESGIVSIHAILKDAIQQPVQNATVMFSTTVGQVESPKTTGPNGVATSTYTNLAGTLGAARIVASYTHPVNGVLSDTVYVVNLAAQNLVPDYITLTSQYYTLPAGEFEEITTSQIIAAVKDSLDRPVNPGIFVYFETNLGDITPVSITDENGRAGGVFSMGTSAGLATVKARTAGGVKDSIVVAINSGQPAMIALLPSYPPQITVQGGGGIESTTIRGAIYDSNGQLVTTERQVKFTIVSSPEGVTFGNDEATMYAETNNGQANVSLNSGLRPGPVQVRASTEVITARDSSWEVMGEDSTIVQMDTIIIDTTIIQATTIPVTVVSGPPHVIEAAIAYDSVEPIGGGFYRAEIAANVVDIHTNPVPDSTHVYWWIVPINPVTGLPDDTLETGTSIIGDSYTGMENLDGDSYPGFTWTQIFYTGTEIFNTVEVHALTWDVNGDSVHTVAVLGGDPEVFLPFFPGQLTISADIQFYDFVGGSPVQIILTANLIDYYGNPSANGRIQFFATGGSFPFGNLALTNSQGQAAVIVQYDEAICTPIPNTDPQQYNPFTSVVWCALLDPMQVTSDQLAIEFRRTNPGARVGAGSSVGLVND